MAFVLNDRVKETTTTNGTSTINLAGAETGFESFVAGIGNSNTTYYAIVHQTADEFEVGIGTVTDASPDTLSRTTIISSSNSDSAVNFSSGTKNVFCTLPASKTVFVPDSGDLTVESGVQDGDILFKGNDGGSTITALTLDMSEQGNATFNKNVIFADNGKALFGAGTDLAIFSDGTDGKIEASGSLILDANGTTISLRDGGTENSQIGLDSAGLVMTVVGSDKDFFISGNDGGSAITGVRVDFSDAGAIICNGNITAFGNTSDIKLKENIEVIPDALDKVKQLKGITFNYKKDGKVSTGLIAQDLEKVLPEAIYETIDADINGDPEDKHLAIRYGNTVGLLVEAIKEQQEQIETLNDYVKLQSASIMDMERRLNELEND